MNTCYIVNEWIPISNGYPPDGRPALVRLEWHTPGSRTEEHFVTALWNGIYWVDLFTMARTPLLKDGLITDWYVYEKYKSK